MNTETLETITSFIGIGAFILTLLVIALYFVYPGAPPRRNILLRNYLNLFVLVAIVGFFSGFSSLAIRRDPGADWLAMLMVIFAVMHVLTTFIAQSIESGTALRSSKPIDPTLIGSGAEAAIVLYGPVARIITFVTLCAGAGLVMQTGLVWAWLAPLAIGMAVFHLVLTATMFSGTNPVKPLSINGWAIPIAGGTYMLWVLMASLSLLLSR